METIFEKRSAAEDGGIERKKGVFGHWSYYSTRKKRRELGRGSIDRGEENNAVSANKKHLDETFAGSFRGLFDVGKHEIHVGIKGVQNAADGATVPTFYQDALVQTGLHQIQRLGGGAANDRHICDWLGGFFRL